MERIAIRENELYMYTSMERINELYMYKSMQSERTSCVNPGNGERILNAREWIIQFVIHIIFSKIALMAFVGL